MSQSFILHAEPDNTRESVQRNLREFIDRLPKDKPFRITIEAYRKPRTDEQNAALWAVAYPPLMEAMGLRGKRDAELLHEHMCCEYFGEVRVGPIVKPRRTTTTNEEGKRDLLRKDDFAKFFDFLQQFGAEHGVFIPDPDPLWREHRRAAA